MLMFLSPQVQFPQSEQPIKVNTEIVSLNVSVTDREGRNVTGLKKLDFVVLDNGEPVDVTFFSDGDEPISIGIVFDRSKSMKGKKIASARNALEKFIWTSHPMDEYFLIAFNDRSQLLLDHSLHGEEIVKNLTEAQPTGNTSLFDAVYLGIDRVQRGTYKRKALLLITDGQDNSSRYDSEEVQRLEKESGVIVYAVGILDNMFLSERRRSRYTLDDLTKSTGGRAFYPNSEKEIGGVIDKIAVELRHLYSIGFTPRKVTPTTWHKLKVSLRYGALKKHGTVRAKSGYFPTPIVQQR